MNVWAQNITRVQPIQTFLEIFGWSLLFICWFIYWTQLLYLVASLNVQSFLRFVNFYTTQLAILLFIWHHRASLNLPSSLIDGTIDLLLEPDSLSHRCWGGAYSFDLRKKKKVEMSSLFSPSGPHCWCLATTAITAASTGRLRSRDNSLEFTVISKASFNQYSVISNKTWRIMICVLVYGLCFCCSLPFPLPSLPLFLCRLCVPWRACPDCQAMRYTCGSFISLP